MGPKELKVNHPLWVRPRTWQTHMKHIYTCTCISKQHGIQIHTSQSNQVSLYFSLQAEVFGPAWSQQPETASEAFICRVTGCCFSVAFLVESLQDASLHTYMAMEALTMAKQQGKQRSCCCQPYNTAYYTLHFRIRRVVDFWCLPLFSTHLKMYQLVIYSKLCSISILCLTDQ